MDNANWQARGKAANAEGSGVPVSAIDLKKLIAKSDGPGLTRLGVHLACLLTTGTTLWWLRESAWLLVLTLLHGYVLAFLFCAMHETAHRTAFASRRLNDWVGHAVAFILLLPLTSFRAFHWDHHRFTQDPDRDPELANGLPRTRVALAWSWLGGPNWLTRITALFQHGILGVVAARWIADSQKPAVIREARIYLGGYAVLLMVSVAAQSTALFWLWLLPMFCGYWFLRPYLLSEHTGCPNDGDMINRTRTTFTNRLVHLFAWNMPYHCEHHAYPAVPFHALPALHQRIRDRLVNTEPGYLTSWRHIVGFLTQSSANGSGQ